MAKKKSVAIRACRKSPTLLTLERVSHSRMPYDRPIPLCTTVASSNTRGNHSLHPDQAGGRPPKGQGVPTWKCQSVMEPIHSTTRSKIENEHALRTKTGDEETAARRRRRRWRRGDTLQPSQQQLAVSCCRRSNRGASRPRGAKRATFLSRLWCRRHNRRGVFFR